MRRRTVLPGLGLLLLLLAGLAAPSIRAEEGRIPIFEQTTITEPGSYVLTRDIASASAPVIEITAAAGIVELDLNGFAVSLSPVTSAAVITAAGLDRLKVHGGTIQRPAGSTSANGLTVSDTRHLIVERVTFNTAWTSGTNVDQFAIRRNEWPIEGGITFSENNSTVRRTGTIEGNEIENGRIDVTSQAGNRGYSVMVRNNRVTGA